MWKSEDAVWFLANFGLLAWVLGQVVKHMEHHDGPFGWREVWPVFLMALVVMFVLWLTSGSLYQ